MPKLPPGPTPEEKVFHIADHVFLGTKYGAADRASLDSASIRAVINVTGGGTRVPNHFAGKDIQYLHLELLDELFSDPSNAVPQACKAIRAFAQQGLNVLVHCSAGLSRSATVVIAWLMSEKGFSLEEAAAHFTKQRGRRPLCNPSFWCYLAGLERELRGWPQGTRPSMDFTPWLLEDLETMGLAYSEEQVTKALQEDADWVNFSLFYVELAGWGFDRLVAAQCVAQRPTGLSMARRAAETALELLEVYKALPSARVFCLRILSTLASYGDARLCAKMIAMGTTTKTLNAMFSSPEDAEVQEACCGILAYLATSSPAGGQEITCLGGIWLFLNTMLKHAGSAEVQAAACGALWSLSGNSSARTEIIARGGVQALLTAMQQHVQAARVQDFACGLLGSLAVEPQGWMAAVNMGAVQTVARGAAMHPKEAAIQGNAQRALAVLTSRGAGGAQAVRYGSKAQAACSAGLHGSLGQAA